MIGSPETDVNTRCKQGLRCKEKKQVRETWMQFKRLEMQPRKQSEERGNENICF